MGLENGHRGSHSNRKGQGDMLQEFISNISGRAIRPGRRSIFWAGIPREKIMARRMVAGDDSRILSSIQKSPSFGLRLPVVDYQLHRPPSNRAPYPICKLPAVAETQIRDEFCNRMIHELDTHLCSIQFLSRPAPTRQP